MARTHSTTGLSVRLYFASSFGIQSLFRKGWVFLKSRPLRLEGFEFGRRLSPLSMSEWPPEPGSGRVRVGPLDPLPKRFAEKIESKFSEARREGGSAAGCVTDEQRRIGGFRPISPKQTERSEPIQRIVILSERSEPKDLSLSGRRRRGAAPCFCSRNGIARDVSTRFTRST